MARGNGLFLLRSTLLPRDSTVEEEARERDHRQLYRHVHEGDNQCGVKEEVGANNDAHRNLHSPDGAEEHFEQVIQESHDVLQKDGRIRFNSMIALFYYKVNKYKIHINRLDLHC